MRRFHLIDCFAANGAEVVADRHDFEPAAQPGPGVLEQIRNHAAHESDAALQHLEGAHALIVSEPAISEDVHGRRDGRQRAPEVVTENREKGVPWVGNAIRVTGDRLRESLVNTFVEARNILEGGCIGRSEFAHPEP